MQLFTGSIQVPLDAPAGRVQVVVATHSPNLSAWVQNQKIVVFRTAPVFEAAAADGHAVAKVDGDQVPDAADALATASVNLPKALADAHTTAMSVDGELPKPIAATSAELWQTETAIAKPMHVATAVSPAAPLKAQFQMPTVQRRATRCVPLGELTLDSISRRKVDRYLDVTKSALLFGGRVILVEGIAEALLLPVIAREFVLNGQVEKLRLFRSAVFVPIEGVDFMPYAQLLLTHHKGARIADRVVAITDGDGWHLKSDQLSPGSCRKAELVAFAAKQDASDLLDVSVNDFSLESELALAGNEELLKAAYLKAHPKSESNWTSALANADREAKARAIQLLFGNTPKGDFAQTLAEELQKAKDFKVPDYLRVAIEALVR